MTENFFNTADYYVSFYQEIKTLNEYNNLFPQKHEKEHVNKKTKHLNYIRTVETCVHLLQRNKEQLSQLPISTHYSITAIRKGHQLSRTSNGLFVLVMHMSSMVSIISNFYIHLFNKIKISCTTPQKQNTKTKRNFKKHGRKFVAYYPQQLNQNMNDSLKKVE